MSIFKPADILLPREVPFEKWAVIACDQFTSEPEYWQQIEEEIGTCPSTLRLILPEYKLRDDNSEEISKINATMLQYLDKNIFQEYPQSYIYVERTLKNGTIRKGIVGALDLEEYSYEPKAKTSIRATEKTVLERIPPRVQIRQDAALELPHILLLYNDPQDLLIGWMEQHKSDLPLLYDFQLIGNGGRIQGWLVNGQNQEQFTALLQNFICEIKADDKENMVFAVGDGNHSLATAKTCYDNLKTAGIVDTPARYALVEIENIQDEAQQFEPIHRILKNIDVSNLLQNLESKYGSADGTPLTWLSAGKRGTIKLKLCNNMLMVKLLQDFLDEYLQSHSGSIDYIHGEAAVEKLSAEADSLGFLLPSFDKNLLFNSINANGVLPRKTFSMGHAEEKRYYIEARRIK